MSTLEIHEAEQAEITARCEASECDHPECKMGALELAQAIVDVQGDYDDNRRRAARALLCYLPAYDDEANSSLTDFLADALHLCDLAGWDFAEIERAARKNYQLEVAQLGAAKDPAFSRAIAEA